MNSTATVDSPGDEEASRPGSGLERPGGSGPPATADAGAEASIPKDDLFHLLQNSRRRAVLRYLRGREGPVRMRDVAEQVAAWEHDTTVAGLGSDERQRVYVALYQSHLDTLAEAGVVEYDKSRGVLEPRPLLDPVAAYTDLPGPAEGTGTAEPAGGEGDRDRGDHRGDGSDGDGNGDYRGVDGSVDIWSRRYLGVSAVGSVLLVGTALDVTVLQALSGVVAGALVLLAFSVLTVARLVSDDRGTGRDASDG